jgi:hypothetical protein
MRHIDPLHFAARRQHGSPPGSAATQARAAGCQRDQSGGRCADARRKRWREARAKQDLGVRAWPPRLFCARRHHDLQQSPSSPKPTHRCLARLHSCRAGGWSMSALVLVVAVVAVVAVLRSVCSGCSAAVVAVVTLLQWLQCCSACSACSGAACSACSVAVLVILQCLQCCSG